MTHDYLVPKVLPTHYRGFPFRSRTEARWAVFFDVMQLQWQYEPEGFPCGGEGYIPDFYFPVIRMFGEVKPRDLDPVEEHKAQQLAAATGLPVLLLIGVPAFIPYQAIHPAYLEDGIEYERYSYSLDTVGNPKAYAERRLFHVVEEEWISLPHEAQRVLFSERYREAVLRARTFRFDFEGRF